ncbi:asparagine synthase-related protein [uncultured Winogradskyella sp.]|uniref:asparagine synthase-related protein n=1 Tax=uncultured Winogradskyella sp. TaxID=395353 RepID=UPI00261AC310|nr:asparagine synthase-related protein [uncultured Winogradskyella sp.]
MKTVKTDIIPKRQQFAKIAASHTLNYEAICVFMATGFFLDQDCYYKDEVCLRPATNNVIDKDGILVSSEPWFKWHYTPSNLSYEEVLMNFMSVFENVIDRQTTNQKVILPLSGGLDSRTQAVALKHLKKDVTSYSYNFENGYPETKLSQAIANVCNFPFKPFSITKHYLWNHIHELAEINSCLAEFTHPRQMAVLDELRNLGDVFSLGHWGDVLFDAQTKNQLSLEEEVNLVLKKIVKPGGLELAIKLWQSWNLEGEFEDYLRSRVKSLLMDINIDNSSAKIRAFKSMYWAPRWTTANLTIFEAAAPITLPYYSDEMCEFICSVPEAYLANRKLQIDYIKRRNIKLAKITWHEHRPFNLNTYLYNRKPYNYPYRIFNKIKRIKNNLIGQAYVQRNWELQFLGTKNDTYLRKYLFENGLEVLVENEITKHFYKSFREKNSVKYSHTLSMLLTLSLWQSTFNGKNKT